MSYHINTTQILVPRNITNFVRNVTSLTCPIEVPCSTNIYHLILLDVLWCIKWLKQIYYTYKPRNAWYTYKIVIFICTVFEKFFFIFFGGGVKQIGMANRYMGYFCESVCWLSFVNMSYILKWLMLWNMFIEMLDQKSRMSAKKWKNTFKAIHR